MCNEKFVSKKPLHRHVLQSHAVTQTPSFFSVPRRHRAEGASSALASDVSTHQVLCSGIEIRSFRPTFGAVDTSATELAYSSTPKRPLDIRADTGNHTCTYRGTHQFDTLELLLEHRREDHNQWDATACDWIDPSTGTPCGMIISRAYDVARHKATAHPNADLGIDWDLLWDSLGHDGLAFEDRVGSGCDEAAMYSQGSQIAQTSVLGSGPPPYVLGSQGWRGNLNTAAPATGTTQTENPIAQKDADGEFPCSHCGKTYLHEQHLRRHSRQRKSPFPSSVTVLGT